MEKVPFFNETARFVHIGSVTIPPNETRDVDPRLLPGYKAQASEGVGENDPLLALIELSIAKLVLGLPDLTDDELARLEALEQGKDKPRQGALAEITMERLRRAELSAPGGLESNDDGGSRADESAAGESAGGSDAGGSGE